jgi:hypothetical protein
MSFNIEEDLALLPIAATVVEEVLVAAPEAAAGQAFSVSSPEPVQLVKTQYNLSFSGTPVTPPAEGTSAPAVGWWEKDVAIFELGSGLVTQGAGAFAGIESGQPFSISYQGSFFGHQQNLILAGTPVEAVAAPPTEAVAPTPEPAAEAAPEAAPTEAATSEAEKAPEAEAPPA